MRRVLIGLLVLASAVPASAAITVTEKLVAGSTSNIADTYNSNTTDGFSTNFTVSFTTNTLALCWVHNSDADTPETVTLTGGGQTWVEVGTSVQFNTIAAPADRITLFRSLGAGAAAAELVATITGGADAQTGLSFYCYQVNDVDTSGTQGSGAIIQSAGQAEDTQSALDPGAMSARTSNSALLHLTVIIADRTWTTDTGFTAGTELPVLASPTREGRMQYVVGGSDNTPTWTIAGGATHAGSFAVEVKQAGGGGGGSASNCLLLLGVSCQ